MARDQSWFGADYTPLDSTISGMPIVGIGAVEVPVEQNPSATGPRSHGVLRLCNVLHVPNCLCNIIGDPIMRTYNVLVGSLGNAKGGIITEQRETVAYFDPQAILFQVKLSGPPIGPWVGPTPFDSSKNYGISVQWPDSGREKWEASRKEGPLSAEEKQWLKKHYGSDFRFLQIHGLSIYKEEDHEEGRAIVRALMAGDD